MIRTLIHIASITAKAVLAVIATILIVPGLGIAGTLWYMRRRRARKLRPQIALEALNQRYALGDIGRTEYLQNRDDILAAQRSSQVTKSHATHIFGEKVKGAWRTLSAPDERTTETANGRSRRSKNSATRKPPEAPISAGTQGSRAARIAAWSLAAAIVVLSLAPPALRPKTGAPHSLEHLIIYVATGFAFGLGYKRKHGLLAILLVIFSSFIEIAQLFVPGRHARLSDFIIDAVAVCIGLVMSSLLSLVA
jgi:VanZ family protein